MTTNQQQDQLATLFASLRNEGRQLPAELLDLHEAICTRQHRDTELQHALTAEEGQLRSMRRLFGYTRTMVEFELHIGPTAMTATDMKKIKAMGGRYRKCLGHSTTRFVHLPNTAEGRAMTVKLLDQSKYQQVTMARSGMMTVHGRDGTTTLNRLIEMAEKVDNQRIDKRLAELDARKVVS